MSKNSRRCYTSTATSISELQLLCPYVSLTPTISCPSVYLTKTWAVPAVYYAHLASNRATSHVDMAKNEISRVNREKRAGQGVIKVSDGSDSEWPKLIPMQPTNDIGMGMWFI